MQFINKIIFKKIQRVALFSTTLFLLSCGNIAETGLTEGNGEDTFVFSASIKSTPSDTKTIYTSTFKDGDVIGVYAVKRANGVEAPQTPTNDQLLNAYAKNVPMKYNGTTHHWEPLDGGLGILIPHENVALDFFAYYPYDSNIGTPGKDNFNAIPITVAKEQNSESVFTNADMLYGTGEVKQGRRKVHFEFKHLFCYVRLTIYAEGIDENNIKDVYLTKKFTKINFDLATGAVTRDPSEQEADKTNIHFHHRYSNSVEYIFDAIIAPQAINSEEEDFEIFFEFSGIKQGYTSRFPPDVSEAIGGHAYYPTVTLNAPPARVKINIEQLVAETNNTTSRTWLYDIKNEGRKLGEVCREYVHSTPYTDENGVVGIPIDRQMIVVYPMAFDGKNIDMTRGFVLAVLKNDANDDPSGTIDYDAPTGGSVTFYYDSNGKECATYTPGTETSLLTEFYVYNRKITALRPNNADGKPVDPIVRTRLFQNYVNLKDGSKYGIVKIGMTHITQQYLAATKYTDGTAIAFVDSSAWKDNIRNNKNTPLSTIHNGTYLYNSATIAQMENIAPGWIVPLFNSNTNNNLFVNYLGGATEIGKYLRQQDESGEGDDIIKKGNNITGLGLSPIAFLNGDGNPQQSQSSTIWQDARAYNYIRSFSILKNNNYVELSPSDIDAIAIRLIRSNK